ncbi:tetratricopeptide repeat protein [Occultella glacieicola]|uniref:Tetratricopeptide repeat protein n=1 Tax=Occultella glacieicola TaxID=2518684 RepID=A0ABY2E5Z3_9MICO|nr:tetratricopeptide repeat protein [Occultella glacieicola]TDE95999.1 tetratricopeptide repeat protein [Occultella glacieicola]
MSQPPSSLNLHGAVDLSALAGPPPGKQPAAAAGPSGGGGAVIDVTEATFNDVVQKSAQVPVVVALYQNAEANSDQLMPVLTELAGSYAGRFLLARVDVATSPRIAQAFQVQAVPSVLAVMKGQPLPLFQGAYPAEQIRQVLDELLRVAAENGVSGQVDASVEEPAEAPEPELPPLIQAAYDAIEADDLDGAAAAFEQALKENPADAEAKAGLAQVNLLRRLNGVDAIGALNAARDAAAGDVPVQLTAADVEIGAGQLAAGFARIIGVIRVTAGQERDEARLRLLDLFLLAPDDAPELLKARRDLAVALY